MQTSLGHNEAEIVGPVARDVNLIREKLYDGSVLVLDSSVVRESARKAEDVGLSPVQGGIFLFPLNN